MRSQVTQELPTLDDEDDMFVDDEYLVCTTLSK